MTILALQNITQDTPLLIAGGGIGGLSAALALARQGACVEVLEQNKEFSELGAGIQLGSNATRILFEWGLQEALMKYIVKPECIRIINGKTGQLLNKAPLDPLANQIFGSPYFTILRADLQTILLKELEKHHTVNLNTDFKILHFDSDGQKASVISESGNHRQGIALIGADGVGSTIRKQILPQLSPKYSGKTAWRALIDIEKAPESFRKTAVSLYMGPKCHLVHYPVSGGKKLNIVAVIDDPAIPPRQWDNTGDATQLLAAFSPWSPAVLEFLSSVKTWKKWALFEHQCPKQWTMENVTLLGDAIHPTLPFMAQGAVMAIEDAQCLSKCLERNSNNIPDAFLAYQKQRAERVGRVQKTSRKMGGIYHLRGPAAMVRNTILKNKKPDSLLKDYTWLYGHSIT